MAMVWAASLKGIQLPWDEAASIVSEKTTGEALKQQLMKRRAKRVGMGLEVPPLPNRTPGAPKPVFKDPSGFMTTRSISSPAAEPGHSSSASLPEASDSDGEYGVSVGKKKRGRKTKTHDEHEFGELDSDDEDPVLGESPSKMRKGGKNVRFQKNPVTATKHIASCLDNVADPVFGGPKKMLKAGKPSILKKTPNTSTRLPDTSTERPDASTEMSDTPTRTPTAPNAGVAMVPVSRDKLAKFSANIQGNEIVQEQQQSNSDGDVAQRVTTPAREPSTPRPTRTPRMPTAAGMPLGELTKMPLGRAQDVSESNGQREGLQTAGFSVVPPGPSTAGNISADWVYPQGWNPPMFSGNDVGHQLPILRSNDVVRRPQFLLRNDAVRMSAKASENMLVRMSGFKDSNNQSLWKGGAGKAASTYVPPDKILPSQPAVLQGSNRAPTPSVTPAASTNTTPMPAPTTVPNTSGSLMTPPRGLPETNSDLVSSSPIPTMALGAQSMPRVPNTPRPLSRDRNSGTFADSNSFNSKPAQTESTLVGAWTGQPGYDNQVPAFQGYSSGTPTPTATSFGYTGYSMPIPDTTAVYPQTSLEHQPASHTYAGFEYMNNGDASHGHTDQVYASQGGTNQNYVSNGYGSQASINPSPASYDHYDHGATNQGLASGGVVQGYRQTAYVPDGFTNGGHADQVFSDQVSSSQDTSTQASIHELANMGYVNDGYSTRGFTDSNLFFGAQQNALNMTQPPAANLDPTYVNPSMTGFGSQATAATDGVQSQSASLTPQMTAATTSDVPAANMDATFDFDPGPVWGNNQDIDLDGWSVPLEGNSWDPLAPLSSSFSPWFTRNTESE